ncbi:MAG: hypothetical protein BWY43_00574 [candidate division WS2 bacterium ADurb.Bin280]|uniref:EF-hand domain-containing protein n=1 Tax=candidate division WS2 bacterium ADurb.Bin280 TaxID=1852829 RepID=A0A1V5SDI7_9BACT|nr:MAG: hypothetical protein BWY43_00574 [candidate division WS2 bacterium ADurb.Bin280]
MSIEGENSGYDASFEIGGEPAIEQANDSLEQLRRFPLELEDQLKVDEQLQSEENAEGENLKEVQRAREQYISQIVNAFVQINQSDLQNSGDLPKALYYIKNAVSSSESPTQFLEKIKTQGSDDVSIDQALHWSEEGLQLRRFLGKEEPEDNQGLFLEGTLGSAEASARYAENLARMVKYLLIYEIIRAWGDGLASDALAIGVLAYAYSRYTRGLERIKRDQRQMAQTDQLIEEKQLALSHQYYRQKIDAQICGAKIQRERSYHERHRQIGQLEGELSGVEEQIDLVGLALKIIDTGDIEDHQQSELRGMIVEGGKLIEQDLSEDETPTAPLLDKLINDLQSESVRLRTGIDSQRNTMGYLAITLSSDQKSKLDDPQSPESRFKKISAMIEELKKRRSQMSEINQEAEKEDPFLKKQVQRERLTSQMSDLSQKASQLESSILKLKNTDENMFDHSFSNALTQLSTNLDLKDTGRIDEEEYQQALNGSIVAINEAIRASETWIDEDFGVIPRSKAEEFIARAKNTNWRDERQAREMISLLGEITGKNSQDDELGSILGQF